MSVRPALPATNYDFTHPWQQEYTHPWWQNANDRVAYERALAVGDFEDRQIAQAMLSQNPSVPNAEIRGKNMNAAYVPPRFGYNGEELTISDILDNDDLGHISDAHSTDFSGRLSNTEATSRPGIYW